MIRLNVFIRPSESGRTELLATARELVAASLGDEGCIAYDIFESATRPDILMICETWRDAEALAVHQATPHFTRLVPRLRELGEMKTEKFDFRQHAPAVLSRGNSFQKPAGPRRRMKACRTRRKSIARHEACLLQK